MAERLINSVEKNNSPKTVVRSFVVSLASPEELFNEGKEPKSVLRFYLPIKGSGENTRLTLFGGRIGSDEPFEEAMLREIMEELNARPFGIPYQTRIEESYEYYTPETSQERRRVILTYNPILPLDKEHLKIPDDEIVAVAELTLDQLKYLIETGSIDLKTVNLIIPEDKEERFQLENLQNTTVPIEGHLTINPCEDLEISEEDAEKRNEALRRALEWMTHIENYVRRKINNILNNVEKDGRIDQAFFIEEYEKLISYFAKKGLESASGRIEYTKKEPEEKRENEELKNALKNSRSILYFMPFLINRSEIGLNWPGLEEAPEEVRVFINFLTEIFYEFLSTRTNFKSLEEYAEFMQSKNPLETKGRLVDELNTFVEKRIEEALGIDNKTLQDAYLRIQEFFRDLSNNMKVADPEIGRQLYQDFVLTNEVNNANLGCLLLLFMGIDTKKNEEDAMKIIRFEAGRQLLLILKAARESPIYDNEVRKIRNGKLQLAINNAFGPILREEIIQIPRDGEENPLRIRIRIRRWKDREIIVDEKPTKSFTSFFRKAFFKEAEGIKDLTSVSIVFRPKGKNDNPFEDLSFFVFDFLNFLEENFPGSKIEILQVDTYASKNFYENLLNSQENGLPWENLQIEIKGKRQGSKSSRFVRVKYVIKVDDELLELTIYPYESLEKYPPYWGWKEVIGDNEYYVSRRMLAGAKGMPSLYDLFFPPELYPHHYEQKVKGSKFHNNRREE